MLSKYITKDGKLLRMGYTTGSCAAAAAKAAAIMLVTGNKLDKIAIITPKGIEIEVVVDDICMSKESVTCCVKKDGGDDPDATNGMDIYAQVSYNSTGEIIIDAGIGVGRVTKAGLNQPIGAPAINSVPRKMITQELLWVKDEYQCSQGFNIIISAPQGEQVAKNTFNPRLGIKGGISILGTSGIVEPMSDRAIIDTIYTEINVKKANGDKYLLITPGNYGAEYIKTEYDFFDQTAVKCSNFIGVALDYAAEVGFEGVLLIGHAGKIVKLAGGLFNTHSRYGDCRAEIMAAVGIVCGASQQTLKNILNSATVDEMLVQLDNEGLKQEALQKIIEKIYQLVNARVYGKMQVEVVTFTQKLGFLTQTDNAQFIAKKIREQ